VNARQEKANAWRQPSERVNKLTDRSRLRAPARDVNGTYGPPELCTWPVGPGTSRFQTNSPEIARKLSKRSKARLVAWGINCFLRIYQERMSRRQAISLVNRYRVSANSAFFDRNSLLAGQKSPGVSPGGRSSRERF
jgi:hypothetical protein